ncbi:hypothetical protein A0O36_01657 [Piscirickettsiaceae bacterium NZ-RLO1]|nr:hypothetical protein A0O36_01657 [Piscirickettsiaceae bacterium NZ-RLO1]
MLFQLIYVSVHCVSILVFFYWAALDISGISILSIHSMIYRFFLVFCSCLAIVSSASCMYYGYTRKMLWFSTLSITVSTVLQLSVFIHSLFTPVIGGLYHEQFIYEIPQLLMMFIFILHVIMVMLNRAWNVKKISHLS